MRHCERDRLAWSIRPSRASPLPLSIIASIAASVRAGVDHLAALGHTRFGLATGPDRFVPVERKVAAFRAAPGERVDPFTFLSRVLDDLLFETTVAALLEAAGFTSDSPPTTLEGLEATGIFDDAAADADFPFGQDFFQAGVAGGVRQRVHAEDAASISYPQREIEEVAEHHYKIDRLMFHVTASANVRGVARLRLGRASEIPANDRDFGADEQAIVAHWCKRSGIPLGAAADIGHDSGNMVVPFGEGMD